MKCPACGGETKEGSRFCPSCGTLLEQHEDDGKPSFKKLLIITVPIVIIVVSAAVFLVAYFALIQNNRGGTSATDLTKQKFEEEMRIFEEAKNLYWDLVGDDGEQAATRKTVEWLKKQEAVEDANKGVGCIDISFNDGMNTVIITTADTNGVE